MKFLKILIAIIILIPTLLIATLLIVPEKVDLSVYQEEIESYLKKKTGYQISLGENLKINILPQPYISAENISVKAFSGTKNIFNAKEIELTASLKDLFAANLSIHKLHVESPEVYLYKGIDSVANWQPKRVKRNGGKKVDLSFIKGLGDIVISNAAFIYEDDLNGSQFSFVDAQFSVDGAKLDQTQVTLSGLLNQEQVNSSILLDLTSITESDIKGNVTISDNTLTFAGLVDELFSEPKFEGTLKFEGPTAFDSFYKLSGAAPNQNYLTFPMNFEADAVLSSKEYTLSNLKTNLNINETQVNLVSDVSYKLPKKRSGKAHLDLKLTSSEFLNLNKLSACKKSKSKKQFSWSKDIVDLAFLKQLNADATIELPKGISCGTIHADHASIRLTAEKGKVDMRQLTFAKGEGSVRGTGYLSAKSSNVRGKVNLTSTAFDITKFMSESTKKRLSAPLDSEIVLNFNGKSVYNWIEGLNGTMKVSSPKVTTVGVNLESLQTAFASMFGLSGRQNGETKGTLSMTGEINKGLLRTTDAQFSFPNVTVDAEGKIDLRRMVMNVRAKPNSDNVLGFNSPVLIKGSVFAPAVIPEITSKQTQGAAIGAVLGGPAGAVIGSLIGTAVERKEAKKAPKDVTPTAIDAEKIIDEKQKLRDEVLRFLQSN